MLIDVTMYKYIYIYICTHLILYVYIYIYTSTSTMMHHIHIGASFFFHFRSATGMTLGPAFWQPSSHSSNLSVTKMGGTSPIGSLPFNKNLGHLPIMERHCWMVHKSGKLTSLAWWLNSHYLQGLTYIPGGWFGDFFHQHHFPLNHRAMGERLEFAWSKCLEKMNQNIFSQIGGLMVMNPMVQSVKNHQLNK